jgi:hydrogenase nickel incorporation protein HypA/HybF
MLNPEQVRFLLGVLAEDTLLEDAEIIIEEVPVEIKCRNCEFTGLANTDGSDHYLAIVLCPKCDERNVEILKGRECNVKTIKIEKSDEDA